MGTMNKRNGILLGLVLAVASILVIFFGSDLRSILFQPTPTHLPEASQTETAPTDPVEVTAESLQIPWAIDFLPSGDMLVTERPGRLQRIGENGQTYEIEGVEHTGEGGLLGLTLHPEFSDNQWLYMYLTSETDNGLVNRIERYTYDDNKLSNQTTIIDNIPGASYHDGGRIAFGPDGYLYITTGDAGDGANAQNRESLAGKILRLNDDGSVPEENPFDSEVYSYGHRNPQGIAWDDKGRLWATEHGRSGVRSGFDELNLIEPGVNYGWPTIQGDESAEGMRSPVVHSGPNETWAPAGLAYFEGDLYFGGLRGETLYRADISDVDNVSVSTNFREKYGRLRDVVVGPDNFLYVSTSNRDGRGNPVAEDDRILTIDPDAL